MMRSKQKAIQSATTSLELLKANNNGKVPYGAIAQLVGEYKDSFLWLDKDMVKNHLRRLNKLEESKDSTTSTQLSIANTLINLAGNSSGGATTNTTSITATIASSLSFSSAASNVDLSTSILCNPTSESTIANSNTVTDTVAKPDRPKGTTVNTPKI
jgi:hypothetical protein